jgi:uncharacterized PurR-regulated membrane protein YhhQ (DUF165 family)
VKLKLAALIALGYIGTIVLANWLVNRYGLIPAGFGLLVPAGTYSAALALGLRDWLHETAGVPAVLVAIVAGCLISWAVASPKIALASAVAFGVSELADLCIYSPLRERQRSGAIAASNAVGSVVDTLIFLAISGFGVTARNVGGQLLVKAVWATGGFLLVDFLLRSATSKLRTA